MYEQTALFFYKFRLAFAVLLAIAIVTLTSALVTALGSNTVLDTKTHPRSAVLGASTADTPNAVTDIFSNAADGSQRAMISAGVHLYGACRSVTSLTAESVRAVGHGSVAVLRSTGGAVAFVARGIGTGALFAIRGVGSGSMFTLHTAGSGIGFILHVPGKIIGSVTRVHTVSAVIRPADDTSVPVISAETSSAILARFNEQQQQQIAQLQAAQLVANQGLDGSVVAGDPKHGGYPAKWDDPVPQDSLVDSWGMYSRECVSYAAWKVYQTYGDMPYWGGVGNANQWLTDARNTGIPTGSAPQVHAVAISMRGYYGHAMWVEAVNGDMIYVSQYNYDLRGHYSEMWVKASSFTYIYFK
jgi:surface antigen